jgi:hypothetical protein
VTVLHQELLTWQPPRRYDVWHDRAVFHFLVDDTTQAGCLEVMHAATGVGSRIIIGVFAAHGPMHCSELPDARHDPDEQAAAWARSSP